jgi:hypothetical protein
LGYDDEKYMFLLLIFFAYHGCANSAKKNIIERELCEVYDVFCGTDFEP